MHRGVFTFVTKLQDEVHRFAIEYQRESRKKQSFSSSLTQVPGVGPATAKVLLKTLKTIKAIAAATEEELAGVQGVSAAAAKALYMHYHPVG